MARGNLRKMEKKAGWNDQLEWSNKPAGTCLKGKKQVHRLEGGGKGRYPREEFGKTR